MDRYQSIELLNATHNFPCEFTFKAIGAANNEFVARVVSAVREGLGGQVEPSYFTRSTPQGRHVSVTVLVSIDSAEQVLFVYDRLRTVDGIVMAL